MKYELLRRGNRSIWCGVLVGVSLSLMAAFGQETESLEDEAAADFLLDPIVITGSNIPTADPETVAPVLRLSREDLDRSGAQSLYEALKMLPQSSSISFDESFAIGFASGSSAVGMRGLSPTYSLVLLNGRRVAPYAFAQGLQDNFVNLNTIPLSAVESVEILKDGASAIYGADAVAGVVNVQLKEKYDGAEIRTTIGNTTNADAFQQNYAITAGVVGEKSSVMLIADYFRANGIKAVDRDYSANENKSRFGGIDFRRPGGNPGTVFIRDGSPSGFVTGPYQIPGDATGLPSATSRDAILAAPGPGFSNGIRSDTLIPELERMGALARFRHDLTDRVELFLDSSFRRSSGDQIDPLNDLSEDKYTVAAGNPFNPFGEDVGINYRLSEIGNREVDIETDAVYVLPGVRFEMETDWRVESALLYSRSKTEAVRKKFIHEDNTKAALTSTDPATALNVFGAGDGVNSPAVLDSLQFDRGWRSGDAQLYGYDAKAAGPGFGMPGGDAGLAVGMEHRWESLSDIDRQFPAEAEPGMSVDGDRQWIAGYGELSLPIFSDLNAIQGIRALEIQVAGRYEHYSDFGGQFSPKAALKYKPVDDLLFRGSYAQGFRAPGLNHLFMANAGGLTQVFDPVRMEPIQIEGELSGNPDLEPEDSESFTAGLEFKPEGLPGFRAYVDWYHINLDNQIGFESPQGIVEREGEPGVELERAAASAADAAAGLPGRIVSLDASPINQGDRRLEGIEFGVSYDIPLTLGQLHLGGDVAYQYKGQESFFTTGPQWQFQGKTYWDYDRYSVGANVTWIGGYSQPFFSPLDQVESWTSVDLQASVELSDKTKMTLGVLNVADQDPPFFDFFLGYNGFNQTPRGRFVYASLSWRL